MKVELEKFKNVFEGFNGGFGVFHFKDSPGPKQKGKNYTHAGTEFKMHTQEYTDVC